MLEELVKSLRNCVADENGCCFRCPEDNNEPCQENLMTEAANAIEKLATKLATLQDSCEWIPVEERLPEEAGNYLVCGRWRGKQTKIWACEYMTLGCFKGWANNAANPFVSYWMPLPEPPKEEI